MLQVSEKLGGRTRARTWDPLIKSQLLYQLSYAPGTGSEKPSRGGSFSKATPHCPAKGPKFSRPLRSCRTAKSRWIPAAWRICPEEAPAPSEPLAAALVRPAIAVVTVVVEAAGAGAAGAVRAVVHHASHHAAVP